MGELLNRDVGDGQDPGFIRRKFEYLAGKCGVNLAFYRFKRLKGRKLRQQHVFIVLIADCLYAALIHVVVSGKSVIAHLGNDTRGYEVIVTMQPLALRRGKDGVVRR